MATGRFTPRYSKFQIEDSGGTLRDIPVRSYGNVGLTYDEIDVSAFQELVKGFLTGQANFELTLSGPFDNRAAAAASGSGADPGANLSGSLTVLQPLNGGLTPRAFGVYFGVLTHWTTGDPVFGADNSVIVSDFTFNPEDSTYTCKIKKVSGGTDPAWGTTAITVA
jgi:hypothetical protein